MDNLFIYKSSTGGRLFSLFSKSVFYWDRSLSHGTFLEFPTEREMIGLAQEARDHLEEYFSENKFSSDKLLIDLSGDGLNRPVRFVARKSTYSLPVVSNFYAALSEYLKPSG